MLFKTEAEIRPLTANHFLPKPVYKKQKNASEADAFFALDIATMKRVGNPVFSDEALVCA
ncbi:hypothetical protein BACIT_3658 [Bacillus amyloliquefaciens]|nr:hypothetical protein BACIT_3658 [Bacillus amyloliquefaciens]